MSFGYFLVPGYLPAPAAPHPCFLQDRLREQARRGSLAVENRHTEIIRNAVRPFLEDNGVWAIAASSRLAQQHRLSNEGAAQLEGGFYGEEVTRSAIAATAAGAEIVAADRSKNLSKHRFKACALQKLSDTAESFQHGKYPVKIFHSYCRDSSSTCALSKLICRLNHLSNLLGLCADDISIIAQALCVVAENIASGVMDCVSAATTSKATVYGNSVHPIFHAASSPEAAAALAACGCDVDALMESLHHLMTEGSEPGAQVRSQPLACSVRIEVLHAATAGHA